LRVPPQIRPGVYSLFLTLKGEGKPEDRVEKRAIAFNVDATAESDLKRADRDRLLPTFSGRDSRRGKLALRSPGDTFEEYKERQPDASESPWLYLFFILILVVEQAMAVHLSHHLKGAEGAPAAPASRPQPAAA